MGITFRDGRYVAYVRIGKRTIKEGEFALVWNVNGRCTKYHGPRLVRFWYSTIRFCTKFVANEKQYLVVCQKDGRTIHKPGPCSEYLDHLLHESMKVENGIQVNADECLVVYNEPGQRDDDGDETKARELRETTEIKYGPCLFIPEVSQRVETIAWTETNTLSLREQRSSVSILSKTKDDHEIGIKITFSWIVDRSSVLKLLSATKNPLEDLTYALKMDVSKRLSSYLHDDFIKDKDPFQTSDTFNTMYGKAANLGVLISHIHYEGYQICSSILKERNAMLKSQADEAHRLKAAEEKEKLSDFALEKKMARAEMQAQSNLEEVNQREQILDKEHSAKLEREMKEHRQRMEQQRELSVVKGEYLKQLKDNDVDLTKYLIALALRDAPKKKTRNKKNANGEEVEEDGDLLDANELLSATAI